MLSTFNRNPLIFNFVLMVSLFLTFVELSLSEKFVDIKTLPTDVSIVLQYHLNNINNRIWDAQEILFNNPFDHESMELLIYLERRKKTIASLRPEKESLISLDQLYKKTIEDEKVFEKRRNKWQEQQEVFRNLNRQGLISINPGEFQKSTEYKKNEPVINQDVKRDQYHPSEAKHKFDAPSLNAWKPRFDPSGAKYKCIVSNVSHPVLKGVYTGFAIRDELWKRSNGQIYIDYKPFSMLGGEVEVLNQLQMGAIQGMGVSSVASTNLGPRFGVVNLPFLIDSFDKLDKFINSGKLFDHFLMAMDHQGIIAVDITGYGNYGWATTSPVRSIADAQKQKFRIAEAAVNQLTYANWDMNPVVMPWPDVPVALKQGVITGFDHTPMVCNITKKFEVAKYFTQVNYAQGLFIWIFNKAWFDELPADLQKTFKETVHDVCAQIRAETAQQEIYEIEKAKVAGVQFFKISDSEIAVLKEKGNKTHQAFAAEINELYPGDSYHTTDYLKEVQVFMGYSK
jgi:TRAP-type C4-dicarboxylate transport system substrate-binding protein